jgi:glycerol-3-phosphate dehydrogenase (NAD(P)+)
MKVAILGGGNFGTAVANIVAGNGHPTALWMRDADQAEETERLRENRRYLPGYRLSDLIEPTANLDDAVAGAAVVFVSVPSASFRQVARRAAVHVDASTCLVSATKGIQADGFRLMSQILGEAMPANAVGAISGPNLAEEMAAGHYTGTVIASTDAHLRAVVQDILKSPTFRVYASEDVYGIELAGALKNIYAIVCGLAAALEVGQNTVGMLITRSLAEMSRFAVSLGANPFTFLGLAGVGDLLVTCTSPLSRNYQLGQRIGSGLSLDQAVEDLGKLAEGVNTLRVVYHESRRSNTYMPLVEGLYRLLFEGADIERVIAELMTGGQSVDVEFAAPSEWRYGAPAGSR